MKILVFFLLSLALAAPAFGKTYTRCSLAKELFSMGVPKDELARWTCIAERESSYRTGVVGPPNSNGTKDYGIFQINNKYWCQPIEGTFSYNECKISCNALLTDNISASVKCARKIQKQQGWTAWSTWKFCKGTLPTINTCF